MHNIKRIVLLLSLFFCYAGFAQSPDSLKSRYNRENIVRFGNAFKKGNEKLAFADLRNGFNQSSLGFDLYQSARSNKTTSDILRACSYVSMIAVLSFVTAGKRNGAYISLGTQFLFLFSSSQYRKRHIMQTDQALIERNREMLFR